MYLLKKVDVMNHNSTININMSSWTSSIIQLNSSFKFDIYGSRNSIHRNILFDLSSFDRTETICKSEKLSVIDKTVDVKIFQVSPLIRNYCSWWNNIDAIRFSSKFIGKIVEFNGEQNDGHVLQYGWTISSQTSWEFSSKNWYSYTYDDCHFSKRIYWLEVHELDEFSPNENRQSFDFSLNHIWWNVSEVVVCVKFILSNTRITSHSILDDTSYC